MALFGKSAPQPPAQPAPASDAGAELGPLTHERVVRVLEARGYAYGVDSDGDVGGRWDDHVFYFLRIGRDREVLQVRGRWNRSVPASELPGVLEEVNLWNTDTIFPKVYVRVEGDELGVYGELAVDYEHGVTDEQIDLHLGCGVSLTLSFFERLDERYPDAVDQAKARIAGEAGV
jgi:hypothetical protein